MLINQMMGKLFGDFRGADSNAAQLKPGQVVKGEVLQKLDGQEALLKINHTVVRARLEADLQPGQTALLQVQPHGADGEIVLRTVTPQIANEASLQSILKSFQLTDSPEHRLMLRMMQESGVPITREMARAIAETLMARPSTVSVNNWLQSAIVLAQRSLPVTTSSVQAMQAIMFGPSITQTMSQLQELVTVQVNHTQSGGSRLASLLHSLANLLGQVNQASQAIITTNVTAQTSQTSQTAHTVHTAANTFGAAGTQVQHQVPQSQGGNIQNASSAIQAQSPQVQPLAQQTQPSAPLIQQQVEPFAQQAQTSTTPGPSSAPGTSAPGTNVSSPTHQQQVQQLTSEAATQRASLAEANAALNRQASAVLEQASSTQIPGRTGATDGPIRPAAAPFTTAGGQSLLRATNQAELPFNSTNAANVNAPTESERQVGSALTPSQAAMLQQTDQTLNHKAAAEGKTSPVLQLLKLFGLTHEADVQRFVSNETARSMPNQMSTGTPLSSHPSTAGQPVISTAAQGAGQLDPKLLQSLKSVLLQIQSVEEASPALKETAQQLTQQITGQQLLLQDRSANFSHLTFMLPMFNEQGQQTAAVSIHSRKKADGSIDADNCRLLFDLEMQTLGPVILDVNVVNKRVQIQLYNDFPALQLLIESSEETIQHTLAELGMEMLPITFKDYPAVSSSEQTKMKQNSTLSSMFSSEPYKGVDVRV